jgi:hypothetical protein
MEPPRFVVLCVPLDSLSQALSRSALRTNASTAFDAHSVHDVTDEAT